MKIIVFVISAMLLCCEARCTSISTTDGMTYNNISAQRVDPDGLYVEYTLPGGGVGMSKIKFSRLSPDQQKQFRFDANKARDYETGVAKANDDFGQEALREGQIENAARLARNQDNERVAESRMMAMTQLQAAQANSYPVGGPACDWSYLGGGYGLYAVPRVGRMPRNGTTYAPIVTPIPFPRINTPRARR
jgi:hypothetical protein